MKYYIIHFKLIEDIFTSKNLSFPILHQFEYNTHHILSVLQPLAELISLMMDSSSISTFTSMKFIISLYNFHTKIINTTDIISLNLGNDNILNFNSNLLCEDAIILRNQLIFLFNDDFFNRFKASMKWINASTLITFEMISALYPPTKSLKYLNSFILSTDQNDHSIIINNESDNLNVSNFNNMSIEFIKINVWSKIKHLASLVTLKSENWSVSYRDHNQQTVDSISGIIIHPSIGLEDSSVESDEENLTYGQNNNQSDLEKRKSLIDLRIQTEIDSYLSLKRLTMTNIPVENVISW